MSDRMMIQELGINTNPIITLKKCMDNKNFERFMESYRKNPFIISGFKIVIPNVFIYEEKKKRDKEKGIKKTGIQLLMERNKNRYAEAKKQEVSWLNFVVRFMDNSQQPYDIVDRITYSYMKNIIREKKQINEDNNNNNNNSGKSDMEKIAKNIYGRGGNK